MFHKAIIFSLGVLALTGCDAQKKAQSEKKAPEMTENTKAANPDTQKDGFIYLSEGENKFLREFQMNVTFKGISEDSRCPAGVNCIWAGAALAQIEVMGTSTRPMILSLATMDFPAKNYQQSANFNGYSITLQEVTPYPKADGGVKALDGKYKIAISIKKAGKISDSTTK